MFKKFVITLLMGLVAQQAMAAEDNRLEQFTRVLSNPQIQATIDSSMASLKEKAPGEKYPRWVNYLGIIVSADQCKCMDTSYDLIFVQLIRTGEDEGIQNECRVHLRIASDDSVIVESTKCQKRN